MPKTEVHIWSRFDRPDTIAAPEGTSTEPKYMEAIDENGHRTLEQTGETDTYAMIQASLEETKIENIIRRATLGDPTALTQTMGAYVDTTDMPTSLAEMQNAIITIENEFNKLPLETRLKFNQSPEKYISMYGTEEWAKIMGYEKIQQNAQKTTTNSHDEDLQKGENKE
jgi:hypothetical protein